MSLVGYFLAGSKLKKGRKLAAAARKEEGNRADQFFQEAYKNFAEIPHSNSLYSDVLYNWGFALFHQAQTKSGKEAIKIFEEANTKFSSCLTVAPNHLGAAVDGGVAMLGLAKAKKVKLSNELYTKALGLFKKAEQIQEGCASYNLACMHALKEEGDVCLKALKKAKDHGLLPDEQEIINDDDLANVKDLPWFDEFIKSLEEEEEVIEETQEKTDENDAKEEKNAAN